MRITKFGHACVRIELDGGVVVVDPGVFTQPEAVDGATAVLVTHEHVDHYRPDLLRRAAAPVFTVADVAAQVAQDAPDLVERVTVVEPGRPVDLGVPGLTVTSVGEWHAEIHPELPRPHNCGYVLEAGGRSVYHPGDALEAPGRPVDVLLCPASAPWLRSAMAIDFVRAVGAPTNLAIHDRVYSEAGLGILATQMEQLNGPRGLGWVALADGEDLV